MSLLSRLAISAARAYGILSSADKTKVVADYLVVAGGGGGGGGIGGAGGAGGYLTSTATLSTLNTYSIAVGGGGAAGGASVGSNGVNGSDSVISGTGLTTITATGGGKGGATGSTGGSGGSGRGVTGAAGTSGQGNAGGTGGANSGGGGGGAGAVGGNGSTNTGGNGGNGSASSISGSSVTYAGGGGGGGYADLGGGSSSGGTGGGGGGTANNATAGSGTANSGGGGGGGGYTGGASGGGGAGGSGIVIISYTSATPKFVGGTITTSGGKQIHTFTSSGTLSPITPITAEYLVVAGGGAGGVSYGGGGGAGGYQTSSTTLYSGATYVVTVGAGGAGTATSGVGASGSNSVISGTGLTTITSTGGGGGGGASSNGGNGGSGGGASSNGNPGNGTSGQGNNGGNDNGTGGSGGGGGAGAVGGNAVGTTGGSGGAGSSSSISGSSVTYAGGGAGYGDATPGSGGSGGGGAYGTSGTANTGGGGGAWTGTGNAGSGGSGIVIISYAGSQAFNGGLVTTSGGNTIHTFTSTGALTPLTNNLNNSLRFRSSASAYLSRTPASAGNRRAWTWSGWVKRGTLGSTMYLFGASSTTGDVVRFLSTNDVQFYFNNGSNGDIRTSQVFRDPSAWYHLVFVCDTANATASNRMRIYVNGNQITAFQSATYPAQNYDTTFNTAVVHNIAGFSPYFDGYMADINFIDGQALEPYYFGNNDANGVWKPIQYKGTYGTNGFYLTFADTSALTTSSNAGLGKDTSGNGNYWTTNNISITSGTTYDAMTDVPTNTSATVANYCVLNPLDKASTVTNGNLTSSGGASHLSVRSTIQIPTTGLWYGEAVVTTTTTGSIAAAFGVMLSTASLTASASVATNAWNLYASANKIINNNGSSTTFGTGFTAGDVIQIAVDTNNNRAWFGVNNVWYNNAGGTTGNPSAGTNPTVTSLPTGLFAFVSTYDNTINANFGQRPFNYSAPSGFLPLNTFNLPTPTILQGNKYMDATTYTGTGTSQVIVNQALFRPDLVWVKQRNGTQDHYWFDSIRGATVYLTSTSTNGDNTVSNTLTSFNSNGYSGGGNSATNGSALTYVGWQWQAGQGSTSNITVNQYGSTPSIASTVSVNTTAGFSIVTFTGNATAGATVGHGLGVAPKFVIYKARNNGNDWWSYHVGLTSAAYAIQLNTTNAQNNTVNFFNSTAPSASVLTLGYWNNVTGFNLSTQNYVAYCWAEIAGFSKFGSYTGNGSTDGPFIYTGFRPKFILYKASGSAESWMIYDTSRNPYNVTNLALAPQSSSAEFETASINRAMDILSNGFKPRGSDGNINSSGATYIYAAFAEHPFKNSNAR